MTACTISCLSCATTFWCIRHTERVRCAAVTCARSDHRRSARERLTNYALQMKSREEFIRQLTENLPSRPQYFLQDAQINRAGAGALSELRDLPAMAATELSELLQQGVFVLDVRPNADFAAAHVPGSVNIALSGQFASWAGAIMGLSARPVLVADTHGAICRSTASSGARRH